MSLEWEQVVVSALNPEALGRWWVEALEWVIVCDDGDAFEIRETADRLPGILFLHAGVTKQKQNRLHLDFRPLDQAAEVQRLLDLGASRIDVGQGDASWVVMADPEGNEFCILSAPSG